MAKYGERKLSDSEEAAVIENYLDGQRVIDVAATPGIGLGTVHAILHRHKIRPNRHQRKRKGW